MKIIAIVKLSYGLGYVFDKVSVMKYIEKNIDGARYLVGEGAPLYNFYRYEKASGRYKAFSGREFEITMNDGEKRIIKDDWWGCFSPIEGVIPIAYSDTDNLKKCYVFANGFCCQDAMEEMIKEYDETYNACRYEYYEYQRMLKNKEVTDER